MTHTRRQFLQSSAIWSAAPFIPSFLTRAALAAAAKEQQADRALVILQLSGGNDGLNTIVPYADDEYGRHRSTLRLTASDVHVINDYLGFHPEMKAMWEQFQEGHVRVIQGVGYPHSNRDHAAALHDWHTAHPHDEHCQTGWLGRASDYTIQADGSDTPCVLVGNNSQPLGLNAQQAVIPSIRSIDQLIFQHPVDPGLVGIRHQAKNPLLRLMNRQMALAQEKSQRLTSMAKKKHSPVEYPPFHLAGTLRMTAQLIRADLGIRMYYVILGGDGFGGFDNHANQRDNHAALLRQLSESVSAFLNDLNHDRLLDRVLLITISEFGRTLKENGRHGTGHGAAAPMLLAGGNIGQGLIGKHPSLKDLDKGALKHHTDFRNVFATVLDQWLHIDSNEVLGTHYEPLPFLHG